MDRQQLIETVNRFFIAVDAREWDKVEALMQPQVQLDYTSMTGGQPATLHPEQIIASWKTILPGFDATHHQLGNHLVSQSDDAYLVFCYGTASHFLKNDSGHNLWTVAGTYHISLKHVSGNYLIEAITFQLRFIDGNMELPVLAKKRIQG